MNNEEEEENRIIGTCEDCGGEIHEGEEVHETHNGEVICDNCYCDNYFTCEDCGDIFPNDESMSVDHGNRLVCEGCAEENYTPCAICDEYFNYSDEGIEDHDGDYICDSCADEYIMCDHCHEYWHHDDIEYLDDEDEYLCPNCLEDYEENECGILGYHKFDNWKLFKATNEQRVPFYIGFELETCPDCGDTSNQKEALKTIKQNLNAICSHDGSLNSGGFEIVSHPQSFKYIMENKDKLKSTLDKLIEFGYKSHDTSCCGLHFHVTRPKDPDIIDRIWLILETYKKEIILLSRRSNNELTHWAKFLSDYYINEDTKKLKTLYYIKKTDKSVARYMALNNTNLNTIEFRFFKGTLKFETFMASVEFINNLVTLCSKLDLPVDQITWDKLCKGKYIKQYITDRNITTNATPIDNSILYMQMEAKQKELMQKANSFLNNYIGEIFTGAPILTKQENFSKTKNMLNNLVSFIRPLRELTEECCYLEFCEEKLTVGDYTRKLDYIISAYSIRKETRDNLKACLKELRELEEIGGVE